MGNRVEDPDPLPASYIVGPDVSRIRRSGALSNRGSENQKILEDDARGSGSHREIGCLTIQPPAQVDDAVLSEGRDQRAVAGIERIEVMLKGKENPGFEIVIPVDNAPIDTSPPGQVTGSPVGIRIESPQDGRRSRHRGQRLEPWAK